jgi:hypothetical protein
VFQAYLPPRVEDHLLRVRDELGLALACPRVYPPLRSLDLEGDEVFVHRYRVFEETEDRETRLETTTA